MRFLNSRTLGLLGLALTAQVLSGCVVVPVPHHVRHRPVVVDVQPGVYSDGHHHHRHHHRHRHHDRDRDYRR